MSFATIIYWPFLAIVVLGLWTVPDRWRKGWLIFMSYLFYASWSVPYLALLFGVATANHFGAKWIVAAKDRASRGRWVIVGNLLVLGTFKYAGWLASSANSLGGLLGAKELVHVPDVAVPLGISFFVFEALSYTIDVIRKREKVHAFWDFQLFIAFFPKLIAGPILRAKEFLPQVERPLDSHKVDGRGAMRQIAIGFFLKAVFADGLAPRIDHAFSRPVETVTTLDAWIMGLAFALEVYFDFSGYTRIAIGSAKLCGIDLVENFDHPLISTSPPELWRRWHMSLSRWVRDYLFYPLAQSATVAARNKGRTKFLERLLLARAALLTMIIFGLWHGAAWKFVVWGAYQGAILGAYHILRPPEARRADVGTPSVASRIAKVGSTVAAWVATSVLTGFGWFFFRVDVPHALGLYRIALTPWAHPGHTVPIHFIVRTVGIFIGVLIAGVVATRIFPPQEGGKPGEPGKPRHGLLKGVGACFEGVFLGILFTLGLIFMGQTSFIYFQF